MDLYEDLLRGLLFRLPADTSHELAKTALRRPGLVRALRARHQRPDSRLGTSLAGIPLSTPIGLAPGFDKSGDLVAGIASLGFGYVTVGSITTQPRAGNPKPRLHRYPDRDR
jgi:dihydroorotate dehydrogenase